VEMHGSVAIFGCSSTNSCTQSPMRRDRDTRVCAWTCALSALAEIAQQCFMDFRSAFTARIEGVGKSLLLINNLRPCRC